ncbi:MAG TPA: glycosyltransferase family 1 protein [Candidatus Levybacteria bacterium]|nr:glycosyltransferase family 1 protein [Candidatus Levybacteria bacterium]
MRIGIDCRLWNQTGVGRYIRNLVRGLDTKGSSHTFVLYFLESEYKSLKFNNPHIEKKLAAVTWHSIQEQLMFPRIIAKDSLDLMHFTYYSVPVLYNKPFVLTLHDVIISHFDTGEASTLPLPVYKAKRLAYSYTMAQATRKAKKVIVPLDATRRDVEQLYPHTKDKIVVTKEGFDIGILESGTVSEKISDRLKKRYFLYVGNAYPHKNLPLLIQAFKMFKDENQSNIQLLLVGKNDYFYQKLHPLFSSDIIHLPDVSDYELGQLYKNALALIAPSHMEGFGLPVLEAMSVGCIVAASDIPAFKELCGNAAIFFDQQNSQNIKNVFSRITNMATTDKNTYIQNGQKKSQTYSWDTMVRETLAVYDQSISS